jgi:hypothetical protein
MKKILKAFRAQVRVMVPLLAVANLVVWVVVVGLLRGW